MIDLNLEVEQHRADLLRTIASLRKELDGLVGAVREDLPELAVETSRRLVSHAAGAVADSTLLYAAQQRVTSPAPAEKTQ